ncbi:MAG: carbonic anhydrase [Candidatus Eisenbacteria bacterium]
MKRLMYLLPAIALFGAVATAWTETTPDQVHRALETKQHIQQRVSRSLASEPASRPGHASATEHAAAPAHAAPASHPAAAHGEATGHGDADVWASLLEGNRRFVSGHTRSRTVVAERAALVSGQHPRAIILACADSRVGPELLFDQSLGDLFVVRNAGNIPDPIVLGSMEYAVEHLGASLIVVLGHQSCGAVKAAAGKDEMPSPNLVAVVQEIRPTAQRLSSCFEGAELVDRTVRANAKHTAEAILANSGIIREAVEKGHVKVVSAYYDLATGQITQL